MNTDLNEALLETGLARLESVRSWSLRVISRFEHFIRQGDAGEDNRRRRYGGISKTGKRSEVSY